MTPIVAVGSYPKIAHQGDGVWATLCELCNQQLDGMSIGSVLSAHSSHVTRNHGVAP